jgi:hypothetical protein
MRAILIHTPSRSIQEIELDDVDQPSGFKKITKALSCDLFCVAGNFNKRGYLMDSLLVDDEGLLKSGNDMFDFKCEAFTGSFAGTGLILGVNLSNGESVSAASDLFDIANAVSWTACKVG